MYSRVQNLPAWKQHKYYWSYLLTFTHTVTPDQKTCYIFNIKTLFQDTNCLYKGNYCHQIEPDFSIVRESLVLGWIKETHLSWTTGRDDQAQREHGQLGSPHPDPTPQTSDDSLTLSKGTRQISCPKLWEWEEQKPPLYWFPKTKQNKKLLVKISFTAKM